MADDAQDKKPEGKNDASDDKKVDAPDKDHQKMQAAHDMAQAEARKANKLAADQAVRIKELEAKAEGDKTDADRLATLEVENARSKVALKHGLSMDDAEALTGTPAEIQKAGEYWGEKLKAKGATDDKAADTINKDTIDKKVDDTQTKIKDAPKPKGSTLTWMETYKMATVPERHKMDEQVKAGHVDPTADYKE